MSVDIISSNERFLTLLTYVRTHCLHPEWVGRWGSNWKAWPLFAARDAISIENEIKLKLKRGWTTFAELKAQLLAKFFISLWQKKIWSSFLIIKEEERRLPFRLPLGTLLNNGIFFLLRINTLSTLYGTKIVQKRGRQIRVPRDLGRPLFFFLNFVLLVLIGSLETILV